jgi:hypothetical protein
MGPVVETTATPTVSDSTVTGARLMIHLKENNIQYLLAVLILYSMGATDKLLSYGSGLCG